MLYNASGGALEREYRPPEAPADILARLRQIDSRIGLLWSPKTRDNLTGETATYGHWMITYDWHPDDKRWSMVRQGEMAREDARDSIGNLPPDCAAEQAYGWFVQNVKRWNGSKDDVTRLLSRAHHFNAEREKEIMASTMDYADELIHANAPSLFRSIGKTFGRFFGAGFGKGTTTRREAI